MGDLKLFRTTKEGVTEIQSKAVELEKSLQTLIEKNLEAILGVRMLASEHSTGKAHAGRIDTLGIDENLCPVIVEYKRSVNENVINQGLFYLDWLVDHKAEFKIMVMERIGQSEAEHINWEGIRLLCIASDFTRFDQYAVMQIDRNIELIRYRRFGEELLMLDAAIMKAGDAKPIKVTEKKVSDNTAIENSSLLSAPLSDLFETIRAFLLTLGDDVQEKQLSEYVAFKRLKNFACVEFRKTKLLLFLKVNPASIQLEAGFSRDVRSIGHFGTGDLELTIKDQIDFEKAKHLMVQSYGNS